MKQHRWTRRASARLGAALLLATALGCQSDSATDQGIAQRSDSLVATAGKVVTTKVNLNQQVKNYSNLNGGRIELQLDRSLLTNDPPTYVEPGSNDPLNQTPSGTSTPAPEYVSCRRAVWRKPASEPACPVGSDSTTASWRLVQPFGANPPPALAELCIYDWQKSSPIDIAPLKQHLKKDASGAQAEPDCPLITAQGGAEAIPTDVWRAFEDQTLWQASALSKSVEPSGRVRVAVLDSAAVPYESTVAELVDTYGHGRLMGRLVDTLSCGGSDTCAVRIVNELVLPFVSETATNTRGGYLGTRVDLALGIHRAVQAWAASYDPSAPERLVLNMSVGWDAMFGDGSTTSKMSPATHAVYTLLQRAACMGAAAVAASGNVQVDSRAGALLPAAWERFPALSGAACARYVGYPEDTAVLNDLAAPSTKYRPLVHATAAVDAGDALLITSRERATPRFVGYGLKAVTEDDRTGHTDMLSGSSVSTAVLSAAIASAWSVRPELASADVAALVYDAAVPLRDTSGAGPSAELCMEGAACAGVRRVSVCDAARRALCDGAASCEDAPVCATPAYGAGDASVLADVLPSEPYESIAASECTASSCRSDGPTNPSRYPWLSPQPGRNGCDTCNLDLRTRLARLTLQRTLAQSARVVSIELDNGRTYQAVRNEGFPSQFSIQAPTAARGTRAALVVQTGTGSAAQVSREPLPVF